MNWDTVIGLEVHAQLKTKSKLFSGASTTFGGKQNAQTSFVDAGLPGVLPVLNQEAVTMAIKFGLAVNADINDLSYFERKNYFYPDLPKGYQISQFQRPIVSNGYLEINTGVKKKIMIDRAHLEEDAGKSLHDAHPFYTGIDLNRAGTPLLEIVTTPCIHSAAEAIAYLKSLHELLRFLDICDGNMQEGSFRCDVNISLKPKGSSQLGTRTELKNLNSFRFIEKAIAYEQARHQECLENGQEIQQETRLYSPNTDTTHSLRSKENENDYRYFPDPDLLPIKITEMMLNEIKHTIHVLPSTIRSNLAEKFQLSDEEIDFLVSSPAMFNYFEAVKNKTRASTKTVVNWLRGPVAASLNDRQLSMEQPPVLAEQLAYLLDKVTDQHISSKNAKTIFTKLLDDNQDIDQLITEGGYETLNDDSQLKDIIRSIVDANPAQANDYRQGKEKLLAFFVGQVMRQTKGQADPAQINTLVQQYLINNLFFD